MPQNDKYRYRIMRSHLVVVDFDGPVNGTNVPGPLEGRETFNQWKSRVLGDSVSNVTILVPIEPAPGTQMSTLRRMAAADQVLSMFNTMRRANRTRQKAAVQDAVHQLATYPKQNLEDILDDPDAELEPSVKEFLANFLDTAEEDIEFDDLLRKIVSTYNDAVRNARMMLMR